MEAGGQGEIGGSRGIWPISDPRVWLPTGIAEADARLLREGGGFLYVDALWVNFGL
jgi:hypothetical protein